MGETQDYDKSATPVPHQLDSPAFHTVAGLTTGTFLKATGPASFGFAAHGLIYSDVGADPAGAAAIVQGNLNAHALLTTTAHGGIVASTDPRLSDSRTPNAHQLDGALHTVSGMTTGYFLKATGAATFGFAAHGLTYSDVGATPIAHKTTEDALNGLVFVNGTGTYSAKAIGTDVQAYNAALAAIAAGTWTGASSITTVGTLASPLYVGTTKPAIINVQADGSLTITSTTGGGTTPVSLLFDPVHTFFRTENHFGIGVDPTAFFHIQAGAQTPGLAPLKLTQGTNLTTPEAGAIEWDGTNLYATQTTGPTRKTLAYLESPSFTTPTLGAASATTLTIGGTWTPTNPLEVTSSTQLQGIRILNTSALGTNSGGRVSMETTLTPTTAGQRLGANAYAGWSGAAVKTGATIIAYAAETWSTTASGGYLSFLTTPNGTTSPQEALRIDQDKTIWFGVYTAKGAEDFAGFITMKDIAGNSRKLMVCA